MKMLDDLSFKNFNRYSKKYNVNTYKQSRMVHLKGGCYYSRPFQFIPFDTIEEIEEFEKTHNVKFTYCQNPKCGFKK